jgi:multicomponent Na+:H+ antiporter subunit C
MSQHLLYLFTGVALLALALAGLFLTRHLLRKILALNVMASAVFLLLVTAAYRGPEATPDPVPHAMVLTGIVVAFGATALAVALTRRLHLESGLTHLPEEEL